MIVAHLSGLYYAIAESVTIKIVAAEEENHLSGNIRFPTVWHFDKCRLREHV